MTCEACKTNESIIRAQRREIREQTEEIARLRARVAELEGKK